MADTSGVLARLQAALSVYDPTWDVGVGSATYKILEAVAQEIAYANNNSVLQTYSYDINTKAGTELDAFVNLFGIYRMLGKRSTGAVTFSTNTVATNILDIPIGTQVAVPIGGNYTNTTAIIFTTTAPAIIPVGGTSALVPVTAVLPGITGNVPANTVTSFITTLNGITSITNAAAITGGLDPESDLALQKRWTNTAFNNNAGTAGKYVITALQDPNVTLANAVGQQNFYSEQLQVNATVAVSSSPSAATATLNFVAYSGQTINNVTYTGTTNLQTVTLTSGTTPSSLQSSLNTAISGLYPALVNVSGFSFTVSGNNGQLNLQNAGSFNVSSNLPSPYRLTMSGTTVTGTTTTGSYYYQEYVVSNNPDLGVSGTQSYNFGVSSGYLFPQGNELFGTNLNTYNQITYANKTDYLYPASPTPQLKLAIINSSNNQNLFIGNTPQLISEYNAASSRAVTITSGNYIDVFINGTSLSNVTEQITFNPSFVLTSGNATNYLNTNNYIFSNGSQVNVSGHYYLPLNMQPAISIPSQLNPANNGVADTMYLYNTATSTGTVYPIAENFYPQTTFTVGTLTSSMLNGYFLPISGTTGSGIYPGMILQTNSAIIFGQQNYVVSTSSSGIVINNPITATGTAIGTVTVTGATAIYPIYDNTSTQGSVLSLTALAVNSGAVFSGWPALPTLLSWGTYTHSYNNDVVVVESLIQQSRPMGSNTLVHQAQFVNLTVNVRMVISNGYSLPNVQSAIFNQLSIYFNSVGYMSTISFATVAAQILSTAGVANVRISSINTNALDGTTLNTYSKDFNLASNQLPVLYNINYTVVGASNF